MRILSSLFLVAALSVAAPAKALVFEFEFVGVDAVNGGLGTAIGRVLGLDDNVANQAADAFLFDTAVDGTGSSIDPNILADGRDATQWTNVSDNFFSVVNGEVTSAFFGAITFIGGGSGGSIQDQTSLNFPSPSNRNNRVSFDVNTENGADFNLDIDLLTSLLSNTSATFTQVSAVPLPGAFGFLFAAIAGLGFVGCVKRVRA